MEELTWRERGRLWLRLGLRLSLVLLFVWCLARFGAALWDWFSPFLLAGVFAWTLSPLVRFCQKKFGAPRWLWSLGVLLLVLIALGGGLWGLGSRLGREVVSLWTNWGRS